jgi:hypothetical protein
MIAVLDLPGDPDEIPQLMENLFHPGLAAEYAGLSGDNPGVVHVISRNQLSGKIPGGISLAAEILPESQSYGICYIFA